jgi:hypothetical protein
VWQTWLGLGGHALQTVLTYGRPPRYSRPGKEATTGVLRDYDWLTDRLQQVAIQAQYFAPDLHSYARLIDFWRTQSFMPLIASRDASLMGPAAWLDATMWGPPDERSGPLSGHWRDFLSYHVTVSLLTSLTFTLDHWILNRYILGPLRKETARAMMEAGGDPVKARNVMSSYRWLPPTWKLTLYTVFSWGARIGMLVTIGLRNPTNWTLTFGWLGQLAELGTTIMANAGLDLSSWLPDAVRWLPTPVVIFDLSWPAAWLGVNVLMAVAMTWGYFNSQLGRILYFFLSSGGDPRSGGGDKIERTFFGSLGVVLWDRSFRLLAPWIGDYDRKLRYTLVTWFEQLKAQLPPERVTPGTRVDLDAALEATGAARPEEAARAMGTFRRSPLVGDQNRPPRRVFERTTVTLAAASGVVPRRPETRLLSRDALRPSTTPVEITGDTSVAFFEALRQALVVTAWTPDLFLL